MTPLEAFDLIASAELLEHRIKSIAKEFAPRSLLAREASWLGSAHECIAQGLRGLDDLMTRALFLPELANVRNERVRVLQGAAVDAVEALHGSIREADGERSPLLEALYTNLKVLPLRRAHQDDFDAFCTEFDRRLDASYPKRMLAGERYASVTPALAELRRAFAEWRSLVLCAPLSEDDTHALTNEIQAAAVRLELPCRQAMLLAEAALLAAPDLRDASGIFDKMRKRMRSTRNET
ncbi:MAG: hypothetical protein FWD69_13530 [Polyangiaceae bacterium]|nr:hypothetical protein [Polyangiaceae bacterium]